MDLFTLFSWPEAENMDTELHPSIISNSTNFSPDSHFFWLFLCLISLPYLYFSYVIFILSRDTRDVAYFWSHTTNIYRVFAFRLFVRTSIDVLCKFGFLEWNVETWRTAQQQQQQPEIKLWNCSVEINSIFSKPELNIKFSWIIWSQGYI